MSGDEERQVGDEMACWWDELRWVLFVPSALGIRRQ